MRAGNPIDSLTASLDSALSSDLPDIPIMSAEPTKQGGFRIVRRMARPDIDRVRVYMFPETFGNTGLGRSDVTVVGNMLTETDTVIVIGGECACVYRNGRLDYRVVDDDVFRGCLHARSFPQQRRVEQSDLTAFP